MNADEYWIRMVARANATPGTERAALLAKLAHEITVCARGTYEVGTENILKPSVLRAYNELQHRITGSIRDHIKQQPGIPFETIIEMMREFGDQYGETDNMKWALKILFEEK